MTRHASREDAQRIAQAVVDGAVEWYHKPAYEKGQDLGRATTSIAAEAAINVLTDGLGSLRKIEKAAAVADHFHDLEKGAERAAHAAEHLRDVEKVGERAARTVNKVEEVSEAIEKHAGFRRVYAERSQAEIKKGISSLERQIADHESKITNPERHIPEWSKLDERQRRALVEKKWPSDIARQTEQRNILKSLLEREQTVK